MSFNIKKASGEKEAFNIDKLRRSLETTGAKKECITKIIKQIEKIPEIKSTKEIYDIAMQLLKKENLGFAAHYNLKQALRELGPTGFPFEELIGHLFRAQGYQAEVGPIIPGKCVDHEVDIVITNQKKHFMVECKFHNKYGAKADVTVTLYIKARFDDIEKKWREDPNHGHKSHQPLVITNTKFTSQAIQYAKCMGMNLVGWSYPHKNNLQQMIDNFGVHPITALTTLNLKEKKKLIKSGLILCRDTKKHKGTLKKLGFSHSRINQIIEESEAVCQLK